MSLRSLSDSERRDWIRLVRTPNIGPLTFARLIKRFGTVTHARAALPDIVSRVAKGRRIELPSAAAIEDEITATQRCGPRLIASCKPDFPKLLDPPPPAARLRATWPQTSAARASSRAASPSPAAASIISTRLSTNASTASSPIRAGSSRRAPLATRRAQDFPRRNRINTGLARGSVVAEAAGRSGSLISARIAGEQGRAVKAVHRSPLDPRVAGTNGLIRRGAALVRQAQDALEVLAGLPSLHVAAPPPIDEIARAAGLSAAHCNAVLTEPEPAGDAMSYPGGLVARAV